LPGSKSTTSGRILVRRKWSGQLVPSAAKGAMPFAFTNSSTASWSSKCPTIRTSFDTMPRIAGISAAATSRRSAGGSAWCSAPPNAGTSAVRRSSQSIARLITSIVVS
jgi:hypothetical protein